VAAPSGIGFLGDQVGKEAKAKGASCEEKKAVR